ncbi:FAD linked oxidase domain protein [Carbonactinospora thermoautotrophica]|uniref:FAD linked oxidase domain protein n=1 Tax=Carbonactinospora thermoautotrophica TaxID=1469144 RepID=A0A132MWK0_9ACTN|nr:FAD-linked oxidase C-terminal domain-containing protein [Carbonactinospora thermoautotrophica]KWX02213.1 FAD linked oxidase domain protein [Carbonactinospora thermoautotrophica]
MADLIAQLRSGLPETAVQTDPDVLESYRYDRAHFCPAGVPAAVVLPQSTEQVQHVLRVASAHRVPVVPQGARSGLSGGANAVDGCIVLSLTKMRRILEINPVDRLCVVEPGVINAELSRAVAEHGLFYPPDPSSWEMCTIGGNIATNSGGLCCVKYGVTAQYVLGLEVVLASGEVLRTGRRTVKGVAGYDLTHLFVGSEGTLGVVTQATLALRPAPKPPLTMAALFPTTRAAGAAVTAIIGSGHVPSLLEIMDNTTIRAVNEVKDLGLPVDAAALLIAQSDADDPAAHIAELARLCRENGADEVVEASNATESHMLLEARRLSLVAFERLGTTLIDDVAVPRSRMVDLMDGVAKIADKHEVMIGVLGHAGDGNMHPTVVFDQHDADAARRAQEAYGEIMELGLRLGGTITGEHGVGILKRPWLLQELSPVSQRVHAAIKRALDPLGILNPGKMLEHA